MDELPEAVDLIPVCREAQTPWAAQIAARWRACVAAIIQTGQLLNSAKAALPHGEFVAMITADLPFGPRTAQRLMAIAGDERLADLTRASLLPPSWTTLYELTKLDDDQFREALDNGLIRPDLERSEITQKVKALRRAERENDLGARQCALPRGKFGVIVADPEWRFEPWSRATGMDRSADNHYPTFVLGTHWLAGRPIDCRGRLRIVSLGDGADAPGSVLRHGCLGFRPF